MALSKEYCARSKVLEDVFLLLLGDKPHPQMEDWKIAQIILTWWDGRKLHENSALARECIFAIVLDVGFPDSFGNRVRKRLVGLAETLGVEFFPEIGVRDPTMDVYEWLRYEELQRSKPPA